MAKNTIHDRVYKADIIYRLQLDDTDIYLLIKFPLTVDKFMTFRMLTYVMGLYRELIYNHKLTRLPVTFPLVYRGDAQWAVAPS
ncbi:MAG TPA: Rpn family recombination-promoting nuclease/putative transposase [Spirochaetota bacterium]|nr:Rpn family recombination-promoting nuclease/putative transposase [Spirochaetota bacterium]HOR94794.1 Rpn family recombination-promoting nuclease/putative transposase [Spirochaetota bacterium]HOT20483.1 Rpn family recombination-promoting nuclease/putative transposase [Spirochaetota bacterium]HPD06031.1 Rpn family recombination-promoting nuclease/putative transposase [Spirochaetota bacterium]HPK45920.1 Rpn family recombination-promoting nuclease/putative transposase [Spirochaetota bacterium]